MGVGMPNRSVEQQPEHEPVLADITPDEWSRLLAYCTRVTAGAPGAAGANVAEDLVQQTLLEAWRHASRLYAPEVRMPWLFGIARNVCLRWLRSRGRELSRQVNLGSITQESQILEDSEPAG